MVAKVAAGYCREAGDDVIPLTREQLDITYRERVDKTLDKIRPDAILNCAAYTNVDRAEADVDACFKVNAEGVENLAATAKAIDARFVTISTDYVFDGENRDVYTEDDVPNPQSVYARSKLEGEARAQAVNDRSIIVRSCWIYGKQGKNFLSQLPQSLAANQPIKAISDAYGTPTFARDLARRLRELTLVDKPGLFHVTNSGAGTSYLGFAEKVCELAGFDLSLIEPVSHEDLKRAAPRPVSSKLASVRIGALGLAPLPDWESALGEFLSSEKINRKQ